MKGVGAAEALKGLHIPLHLAYKEMSTFEALIFYLDVKYE
jgi:hypothetical protein